MTRRLVELVASAAALAALVAALILAGAGSPTPATAPATPRPCIAKNVAALGYAGAAPICQEPTP